MLWDVIRFYFGDVAPSKKLEFLKSEKTLT